MYAVLCVVSAVATVLSVARAIRYVGEAKRAISEDNILEYRRAQDQYWFSLILILLSFSAVVGFLSMSHFFPK